MMMYLSLMTLMKEEKNLLIVFGRHKYIKYWWAYSQIEVRSKNYHLVQSP